MAASDPKDASTVKDDAAKTDKTQRRKSSLDSETTAKLEWKIKQRSDASELVGRGIVSEEYEDVLHGNKDISDAEKEHLKHENDTKNKIDKVYKMGLRPTATDIEDRGIAPQGSLNFEKGHENDDAVKKAQNQKKQNKEKFAQKFEQRMKPDEAVARHIIDQDSLNKDYDDIEHEHKDEKAKIQRRLSDKLAQRPNAKEMVARGITEDEKEVGPNAEDFDKVDAKKKQEKKDHAKALNDWKRPSPQDVAKKGVIKNDDATKK